MSNPENETADAEAPAKKSKWPESDKGGRIVQLQDPFKYGDDTITEIEVPKPMVYHMRGLNVKKLQEDTEEMARFLQKLLTQPPKFVDKISFADFQELMDVANDFLQPGQPTGNNL